LDTASTKPSRKSFENEGREFFVKKVASLLPPSFFDEVDRIEKEVESYTKSELAEKYASLQTKSVKIEPAGRGKFLVKTEIAEASAKGYISPSMFVKYQDVPEN